MLPPDSVVSSSDRVLDVAEQGVDPVELRIRHAGTTASGDVALVDAGGRVKGQSKSMDRHSLWFWLIRGVVAGACGRLQASR